MQAHHSRPDAPILIVDDDTDIRESLQAVLELEGYHTTTATQGLAALGALRDGLRPCLILLDLSMPVMDGYAFRREQLQDHELADIPVVVFSGAHDVADRAESLHAEAYCTKPADFDRLLNVVARYC